MAGRPEVSYDPERSKNLSVRTCDGELLRAVSKGRGRDLGIHQLARPGASATQTWPAPGHQPENSFTLRSELLYLPFCAVLQTSTFYPESSERCH